MAFKLLKNRKKEWKNSSSSLNISQFKGRLKEWEINEKDLGKII